MTWILARVWIFTFFLDFIYWTVLILILIYFESRDTENQQLIVDTSVCRRTHPPHPPHPPRPSYPRGTHVFEMRTATGSELFSLSTCPHTTTFTLLCIFSPLEMSSIKIWEKIWVLAREIFFSGCRPRLKNKCTHMIEWQFFCHKTSHWNGYSTDQVCPEKLILVIIETNYCLITGTRLYVTNDQVSWMIRLSRRIFRETSRIGAAKQGAQVIVNYRSCVENNQI